MTQSLIDTRFRDFFIPKGSGISTDLKEHSDKTNSEFLFLISQIYLFP
jgi:hypothetical protein